MLRTRVGYTGGEAADPTYRSLGDHTEAIELDFDPAVISYDELLEVFWQLHVPTLPPASEQYKAAVYVHDEEQRRRADASARRQSESRGERIYTEVLAASTFYLAEAVHQKFHLQRHESLVAELEGSLAGAELRDSTLAARLNGLVSGFGEPESAVAAAVEGGLDAARADHLVELARGPRSPVADLASAPR